MIITCKELKAGDILLGYSSIVAGKTEDEIGKGYIHAAIYLGSNLVAESTGRKVQTTTFNKSMEDYDHFAVIRQPDAWHSDNVDKLIKFIDNCIHNGAKFNLNGIRNFKDNSDKHKKSEHKKLEAYFEGEYKPSSPFKDEYFCSELIVSAYIAIGFIKESAAVIYDPEVTSPLSLGKDPTFGTFVGYIKYDNDYNIPENDEFVHYTSYHELYG